MLKSLSALLTAISVIAVSGLIAWSALASDDDNQPDSQSFDVEISQAFDKTVFINAWDTITFVNNSDQEFTATFPVGAEPLSNEPENLGPTRERGTYWDGAAPVSSGKLAKGDSYWLIILEPGTYEYYNILNPEQKAWVVVAPKTKHVPNAGTLLDKAAIAADPLLVQLMEANK